MAKPKQQDLQQELLKKIAELTAEVQLLKQQPGKSKAKRAKGEARPDVYYVLLGVPSKGLPPQAIVCARILSAAVDSNHIPEAEAMQLIDAAHAAGKLKTDQEPWRIFQYYRPRLIEGDFLQMKSL
jgi:hypothetical protein